MALTDWIGRSETLADVIAARPCAALAATLDRGDLAAAPGTALPPLWHWLYFWAVAPRAELGPDGHPKRGGFLPPVALPRRMWAGARLTFTAPLRLGDAVQRRSTIESVTEKTGRTGPLVFVTVRHEITRAADGALALTERHDIVYRAAPGPADVPPPPQPAPAPAAWRRDWHPDAVLLFRYSALTFNGHRIHYDRSYATETEGYPGLVVHGPLIATLLLDLLHRERPEAEVAEFRFRALRPTFDTHSFTVCGAPQSDGRTVHLWAQDHEGWLTMDATALIG